mmetsp:Transcript_18677/g.40962  ORF Transcript_18677/g.40962 Transcript_18677/m.40962 type:complete len:354 (+) Transcript_18677:262-1323(+)
MPSSIGVAGSSRAASNNGSAGTAARGSTGIFSLTVCKGESSMAGVKGSKGPSSMGAADWGSWDARASSGPTCADGSSTRISTNGSRGAAALGSTSAFSRNVATGDSSIIGVMGSMGAAWNSGADSDWSSTAACSPSAPISASALLDGSSTASSISGSTGAKARGSTGTSCLTPSTRCATGSLFPGEDSSTIGATGSRGASSIWSGIGSDSSWLGVPGAASWAGVLPSAPWTLSGSRITKSTSSGTWSAGISEALTPLVVGSGSGAASIASGTLSPKAASTNGVSGSSMGRDSRRGSSVPSGCSRISLRLSSKGSSCGTKPSGFSGSSKGSLVTLVSRSSLTSACCSWGSVPNV